MALKITTTFNGVVVEDSYARVSAATCNKSTLAFQIDFFVNGQERSPFKTTAYDCNHDLDGSNAIKQAYEALKKMSEFVNAKDC
jgi:hypothetical protein